MKKEKTYAEELVAEAYSVWLKREEARAKLLE